MYTDESLAEIALKCGFADQSHFSREFRRQFTRTPREYREYYKPLADVPVTKAAAPMQ
jgi:AraC-like DNA-binding protein